MEANKFDQTELDSILGSDDINVVIEAMLFMCGGVSDVDWIQKRYLALLSHSNEDVRGLALTCLGHVARIHGKINESLVVPVLKLMVEDPILGGRAQDALDDIEIFVKKRKN